MATTTHSLAPSLAACEENARRKGGTILAMFTNRGPDEREAVVLWHCPASYTPYIVHSAFSGPSGNSAHFEWGVYCKTRAAADHALDIRLKRGRA